VKGIAILWKRSSISPSIFKIIWFLSRLIKMGYSHTFEFCVTSHQFWLCMRCDTKIQYQKFHQFFTWRWSIHEARKVCLDPTWAGPYRSIMSPIGEIFSFWATWITCLMNWSKCSTSNTGRFRMMNMFNVVKNYQTRTNANNERRMQRDWWGKLVCLAPNVSLTIILWIMPSLKNGHLVCFQGYFLHLFCVDGYVQC